jgi:hypothetical protein
MAGAQEIITAQRMLGVHCLHHQCSPNPTRSALQNLLQTVVCCYVPWLRALWLLKAFAAQLLLNSCLIYSVHPHLTLFAASRPWALSC